MICPVCKKEVLMKRNHCDNCGEDLTAYKKVYQISDRYYNEGLEKAKVRDLSGAAIVLRKSLEFNKRNTNARNLLGLIYFEMGESVAALSEWVISKHFQPKDNDADEYINTIQSTPTKLDMLNQTSKKYNSALVAAKQGNDDLAIIQLKKVVSLNPHFVKALQLLGLLYMKNGEKEKAFKYLSKAEKIDVSNTTTLKYLKELKDTMVDKKEEGKGIKDTGIMNEQRPVFQASSYKEDKPNIWLFINLIIGVFIGVLASIFLILPAAESKYTKEKKQNEVAYNEELNKQSLTVDSLSKENENYKKQVADLQAQIDDLSKEQYDEAMYDDLLNAAKIYNEELQKGSRIDNEAIAEELAKVDESKLEREAAKDLYNQMKEAVFIKASDELYDKGHSLYTNRKYDKAIETLLKSYTYNPDNVDAIYFLGRAYHQLGDYENAKKYYTIVTTDFADTSRNSEALSRLAELD